jgi:hypothetical protein
MADHLPEKTCSVERMITNKQDVEKVLNGEKTVTRRNGRYADIGECIELEGRTFQVTDVYKQTLVNMTDEDAQTEGYENLKEYKEHLNKVHPFPGELPLSLEVWVHEFQEKC